MTAWPSGSTSRAPGDPGIAYVLRRFIPQQRDIAVLLEHIVQSGERPELLAARALRRRRALLAHRRRQRGDRPVRAHRHAGRARGNSRADRESEASVMLSGVQLSLQIGPCRWRAPREVVEALVHAKVEDGSGDTQSGFELTFELPARSPLRTLFLLSGGGSLPLMRVVLVVTINGTARIDHRRGHHQCRDAARRGRRVASGRQGQGPVGPDGHDRDPGPAVSRPCRRRCACC